MKNYKASKIKSLLAMVLALTVFISILPAESYATNIWTILKQADSAQKSGDHKQAIQKYGETISYFLKTKDYTNVALMYGRKGVSHAHISDFENAEQSWIKEANMWGKLGKEQEEISANRKANLIKNTTKVFREVDSGIVGNKHYHGAKQEPVVGAYIGAYAEQNIGSGANYFETFPELTGKDHAAYLLYTSYGDDFSKYASHFKKAKASGKAIQLAIQPLQGLDAVKDDTYLRKFARDAGESGLTIFLRFANEMNEPSTPWYTTPQKYVEKFRTVSKVFKEEAPNVVMVWAPNDFPPNTIESFYPGDDYVDWVGVSSYWRYHPELDPLEQSVDRSRYIEKIDHIYKLYADKKPIFISEGAALYSGGANLTNLAADNLRDMYTYIPMLYPKIKAYFYFNDHVGKYTLHDNKAVLDAYKDGISNPYYLSNMNEKSPIVYEDIKYMGLDPTVQKIHAYVKTGDPNVSRVDYILWGKKIGTSSKKPYTIEHDFSQYAGHKSDIVVKAYDAKGKLLSSKAIPTVIRGTGAKPPQNLNARPTKSEVKIDGKQVKFNAYNINNNNYFKIRDIAYALNGTEKQFGVEWFGNTQEINLSLGKKYTTVGGELSLGDGKSKNAKESKPSIMKNMDSSSYLNVKTYAIDGHNYVKLRDLGNEVGFGVEWDSTTNTIDIYTK